MSASRVNVALTYLCRLAAKAIRYRPFLYPSQWMAQQMILSPQATELPGPIDIWRMPANVGIVDAAVEPKRGLMVRKPSQVGISVYMAGLLGWILARYGGMVAYSMAKDQTMRAHVLKRIVPMIEGSTELCDLLLAGRANNETILQKLFTTGSLNMFGAGSENNFISEPYTVMFLDEFDKMGIFPSGNDAVQLAQGRQAEILSPKLHGFSTPSVDGLGISAYVENDSDLRHFFVACPHCEQAVDLDFLRDVEYDHQAGSNRRIPTSARLLCHSCRTIITDDERAGALDHAAKAACPWYDRVEPRADLGWISTLDDDTAAEREYAGFDCYSRLLNPRKSLLEMALSYCSCRTEAQLKVYFNDTLGAPYTLETQRLTAATVEKLSKERAAQHVPSGTRTVVCGTDVQAAGLTQDLVFYYDISAWLEDGKKVTLDIDRLQAVYDPASPEPFKAFLDFIRNWKGRSDDGRTWQIQMLVMDAGFRTKDCYRICNTLSPSGSQWACPVMYNNEKLGGASWKADQQNEETGNARRRVWFLDRDMIMSRAIERLQAEDRVELPMPLRPEIVDHYTAPIQVEKVDRHGNFLGWTWTKEQIARGQVKDDDWLQAAAYCEFAAMLLGLDEWLDAATIAAKTAAEKTAARRDANRDGWRRDRLQRNRKQYGRKRRG